MGSGIAKAIRDKWPHVYSEYQRYCSAMTPQTLLGTAQLTHGAAGIMVANVFGQLHYGRRREIYTDYEAVDKAFARVAHSAKDLMVPVPYQIYVPYNMGCGLGGGDWTKYSAIIRKHVPNAIVCQLE
jgi:hypothetical protein